LSGTLRRPLEDGDAFADLRHDARAAGRVFVGREHIGEHGLRGEWCSHSREQEQHSHGRHLLPNCASIRIRVLGSSSTDAGAESAGISNRCCLAVIVIFSIFPPTATSIGSRYAGSAWVCARSTSTFLVTAL